MKKRIILALLVFVGIIGTLLVLSNKKDEAQLKKASTQDVLNFFNKPKNEVDLPVTGTIENQYQLDDVDESDFVKYDAQRTYVVDYQKLYIIDNEKEYVISEIAFDNFMPTELLLTDSQIILLGIKNISLEVEIIPGRTFPYSNSECVIYILDKNDYSITRYLAFDGSYYVTSALVRNDFYFVLSNHQIFNPETKTFIYPKYFDSLYENQSLSQDELYLSEAGDNVYAIRLLGKLNLEKKEPLELKGFIGVEGIVKIAQEKLIMVSALYDQISKIAIHILSLNHFQYDGYLLIDGYLYNAYAIDIYQNYLRVATTYYQNQQPKNLLYNISLADFKVKAVKEIAPAETVYAIRFDKNYCYISTFLYVDPLLLFDFSNPRQIQMVKQVELEFICEYLQIRDDSIFALGRKVDEDMISQGLVMALFDKTDLSIQDTYEILEPYVDTEVKYNEKALAQVEDKMIFPMYKEKGQSLQIFSVQDTIESIQEIEIVDDYLLRTIVLDTKILCISTSKVYSYNLKTFQLLQTTTYKKIENNRATDYFFIDS